MKPTQEKALNNAVTPRHSFGLRQLTLVLTSLVVGVVLVFNGTSFHLLQRHLQELRVGESHQQLAISNEILVQRLQFYDDLLKSYASSIRIRDLISFDDQRGAVEWSTEVRNALPQAIGAALFTKEGGVLGDPVAQRVGTSCIAFLRDRVAGRHEHRTPLHTGVPSLAHFDLSAPVLDETGTTAGLVFVSFSIEELRKAVENLATSNSALALIDKETESVIAVSSNWASLPDAIQQTIDVDRADWLLRMRIRPETLIPALPTLGATIATGAAVVILLMLLFSRVLIRNYFGVVEDIRGVIQRIQSGGAVDVRDLAKPNRLFPVTFELRDDLVRLSSHHENLHIESRTDGLTGLANRRMFDHGLAYLLDSRLPGAAGFCVALLDLDDFKRTNDSYGHRCGDLVLRALAATLKANARGSDLVSRWGGDEFAVLLPGMTAGQIDAWIERLRLGFERAQRDAADLPDGASCGLSCGYSCVGTDDPRDAHEILHDADQSLYRDKQQRKGVGQQATLGAR